MAFIVQKEFIVALRNEKGSYNYQFDSKTR